ncbi:MAG: signal peptidase II [Helicobacteraceae bacterium]|jgi:signal peptidase II|nr:signal peptidase II [Helicobacteraceae bacterium]
MNKGFVNAFQKLITKQNKDVLPEANPKFNITSVIIFAIFFTIAIALDQWVKLIILNGFRWESEFIDITLTFNKGVAFSMFAALGDALKYLQVLLVLGAIIYVFYTRLILKYAFEIGLLLGAGVSNISDRFFREGVVDYVFWHYGFEFAIFNLADVFIDCAIAAILFKYIMEIRAERSKLSL